MLAIIANPRARRFSLKDLEKIKQIFRAKYNKVDVYYTRMPLDGFKIAQQIGNLYEIVCSYGGDGTLNEVINGIVDKRCLLGILPAGTSDVFALEMSISRNVTKTAKRLLDPKIVKVNLGQVNNRFFILMAGVGMDASAVIDVNHRLKEYSGKFSYILSGIKSVITFDKRILVKTSLGDKECYSLIAANARKYGGNISFFKRATVLDDNLYVCMFNKNGIFSITRSIFALLFNLESKYYDCFLTNEIVIETDGIPIQVDGDFFGYSKACIKSSKKWINIIL